MNILLWILQVLLALHTFMGAVWKTTNTEQSVPSLSALPHEGWIVLIGLEFLCSVGLIAPVLRMSLSRLVPIAAACIAAEMILFCGLHLASGESNHSELIYWLVVACVCGFVAYGRFALKPLQQT